MKNSEFVRKYYSDKALAMLFVRESTDCLGRRVYYGDFEGSTLNYLEAIEKEENWLLQEAKEVNKNG